MTDSLIYIIPLLAGCLVTIASLFTKRATQEGVGVTRIFFIQNWLFFAVLLIMNASFGEGVLDSSRWWMIPITSLTMFLGGSFFLASLRTGDVSIQAPLMGTKVLFVATYTLFIATITIPMSWWIGAGLTFLGIIILGSKELFKRGHSKRSIILTLLSCASFAATDVIVALEAPTFGKWPFLTYASGITTLFSLSLIPFFRKELFSISKTAWKWLWLAAGTLVAQYWLLLYALAAYGQPTATNILYGSRGLWSIVLIWFAGHWFGNTERQSAGTSVMLRRFIGALMIFAAIIIVMTA